VDNRQVAVGDLSFERIDLRQHALGDVIQLLACRREHHASCCPLEERCAQTRFELAKLMAERRLADSQHAGDGCKAPMFRDQRDESQVPHFNTGPLRRMTHDSCLIVWRHGHDGISRPASQRSRPLSSMTNPNASHESRE
jgi:hypothetical protein